MKSIYQSLSILIIFLFLSSCSDDNSSDISDLAEENGITSQFYFVGEVNGDNVVIEEGVDGIGSGAASFSGGGEFGYYEHQASILYNPWNESLAGIEVGLLEVFSEDPEYCSAVLDMYSEGTYTYGSDDSGNTEEFLDGAIVSYQQDGVYWTTNGYDQSESSFEILEIQENNDGWSELIVKYKFSCTLYSPDGASMRIENAEMVGRSAQCIHLIKED